MSWILQEEEKNHKLRWDENQNKYIFITCNWKQSYHNIISGYVEAARLELRERSSLTPPQRSPPQHHLRCWWGDEAVDGGLVTLGGFFSRNRRTLKSWRKTRWGARRRKWSGAIRGWEALWGHLQARGTWGVTTPVENSALNLSMEALSAQVPNCLSSQGPGTDLWTKDEEEE